ncbi:MAG: SBBP repeat-containing protein, partial [Myxococcota bacterium]
MLGRFAVLILFIAACGRLNFSGQEEATSDGATAADVTDAELPEGSRDADGPADGSPPSCGPSTCPAAVGLAKSFGSNGIDYAFGLSVGPTGQLAIAGFAAGPADLGGGVRPKVGIHDIGVASYDGDGDHLWSSLFGGPGFNEAYSAAHDTNGNIFVAGRFSGMGTDFQEESVSSEGQDDAFIASFTQDGGVRWVTSFGGNASDRARGVAVSGDGRIVAVGRVEGDVVLPDDDISAIGGQDIAVFVVSPNGRLEWARVFGSTGNDAAIAVAASATGIYVCGRFGGPLRADTQELTTMDQDGLLLRLSLDGEVEWARAIAGVGAASCRAIAIGIDDSIIVGGWYEGTARLENETLSTAAGQDAFIAGYQPDGSLIGARRFGGPGQDRINGLTVDRSGNVYATGWFE